METRDGRYEPLLGCIVLEQSRAVADVVGRRLVKLPTALLKRAA
jgi:hypothetical protein